MSMVETKSWGPHPEHPIWPPQPWPPHGPGHDHCGCGGHCDGRCGCPDLDKIKNCWREIAALKEIIEQIIGEIGGPIKTGPIRGVCNGSVAMPGNVGEIMQSSVVGAFTQNPQNQAISSLILSPGDWQVAVSCRVVANTALTNGMSGAEFHLNPLPPTVAPIDATFYGSENTFDFTLFAPSSVVNVTTPTLLAFQLLTNQPNWKIGTTDPGSFTFNVMARRMR